MKNNQYPAFFIQFGPNSPKVRSYLEFSYQFHPKEIKVCPSIALWQYRFWSFQTGYTKLERFLHKNQHTKRKVCKVDYFILPLFLMPKMRSVAQNEQKKHPYIFFLLSVQK